VGLARSRAASWRADIQEVSTSIPGGEPDAKIALKIDTWHCSVGVAALRDGCGVVRPVRVVFRLAVADDSFSSAELSGRLGHAHTR
jgi:hypothetical protein